MKLVKALYKIFSGNNNINNVNIFEYFENYNNYKTINNKIIKFITKFKLLGDQLQAIEADVNKNNDIPEEDRYKKRILVTQDRVLCSYCLIHENIRFFSKFTLNETPYFVFS
jgi:hypothetical protein